MNNRSLSAKCWYTVCFETPARPYQDVARNLGVALGSIAYLRSRCLTRLRRHLEKMGWR